MKKMLPRRRRYVDVTYVTEDGSSRSNTDVVKDGEVGTDYTTEKKNFDGYSFSRMGEFSAEATGQVKKEQST
ncbi:MucBP domain-containing protein [Ligilactobacillus salivarius]|uniref:MucBP domain-containing protein n=1 Tax=Ligilactobacillus salivarius TaxID=1624 RepID=UPI001CDAC4F7|nr:MucBP domain-containing protein [Ligilactobacillus salivarius]